MEDTPKCWVAVTMQHLHRRHSDPAVIDYCFLTDDEETTNQVVDDLAQSSNRYAHAQLDWMRVTAPPRSWLLMETARLQGVAERALKQAQELIDAREQHYDPKPVTLVTVADTSDVF